MSASRSVTDKVRMHRTATALAGNLIATLSLVIIGYPLAPTTIRTMLFGWVLVVAAVTRFILGYQFQRIASSVTLRPVRVRSMDSKRLR